jgi:HEAT repeat protein
MIPILGENTVIRRIAAFLFFLNCLVSSPVVPAQEKPTAEKLAVLRSTTQYCLVVGQSYEEAADESLPIDKITRRILAYTGRTVLPAGTSSCPAVLTIEVKGTPIPIPYMDQFRRSSYKFTAAAISGTMTVTTPKSPLLRKFKGSAGPPGSIEGFRGNIGYDSPSDAPFARALEESSFGEVLLSLLGEIYDYDFVSLDFISRMMGDKFPLARAAARVTSAAIVSGRQVDPKVADIMLAWFDQAKEPNRLALGLLFETLKDPRAVDMLIPCITIDDPAYRREAIEALGRTKDPRAAEPLGLLLDPYFLDSSISGAAITALGMIGSPSGTAVLIKRLKNRRDLRIANELILLADPMAHDALTEFFNSFMYRFEDWASFDFVRKVIERFGAWDLLGCVLEHDIDVPTGDRIPKTFRHEEVRAFLDSIHDPAAIRPLLKCLETDKYPSGQTIEPRTRETIARILTRIGPPSVEPLIAFVRGNAEAGGKLTAIEGLGGIDDPRVGQFLISYLDDEVYSYIKGVETAARILGVIKCRDGVDALIRCLNRSDYDFYGNLYPRWVGAKINSAEALGLIGDVKAVKTLIACLKSPHASVKDAAVEALGKLRAPEAVKPLLACLKDPDFTPNVVKALGAIPDVRAVKPLITLLKAWHPLQREYAAKALGNIGDRRAVEPLISVLLDATVPVRASAAEALGQIGDPRAIAPLQRTLQDDDPLVREMARLALSRFPGK